MLENVKSGLVGRTITDVGIVNRGGLKYARVILSDTTSPLLVALDDALITVASVNRKPMGRAVAPASLAKAL